PLHPQTQGVPAQTLTRRDRKAKAAFGTRTASAGPPEGRLCGSYAAQEMGMLSSEEAAARKESYAAQGMGTRTAEDGSEGAAP
ncbi:MAG TPA: hypothetical protein H9874_05765, partial [Candidatus Bilophila faecipullorum]|nr:hypothetical protein [Candidatus Bilophila faecipullorum]